MRAAVTWSAGEFRVHRDVARRDVGPGEVVVRVRAAGVCQTDISLAHGAFGQTMPVVLGHEGAGEILEVGPDVTERAVGERVLLTWVPTCGRCFHCVRGESYLCARRKRSSERTATDMDLWVGATAVQPGLGTATFAEETVVPVRGVIPLPADLPFELAALLGCAVPTGLGAALNSAAVRPGETVVVVGCGGVGLSAIQGAVVAGATTVVAVDPQASRRARALELGATAAAAPTELEAPNPGFDVGIDAVGRSTTVRSTWDAVRRGGRVVVVGAGSADDAVTFSAHELFHDEKTLRGSFYGSSRMDLEVPRMVDLWRAGRLDLERMVDAVVPLERIDDAVRRQLAGDAVRVVLAP